MRVRPREPADRDAVDEFLTARHSQRVARLGELLHPLDHPALVAEGDGRLAGVLTYVVSESDCEVLTFHVARQWRGVGSALLERVETVAGEAGCRRLWVITTNDNVDALRFYQRRGFRLAKLHAGAVTVSRERLKPEIPKTGEYDIPLRDELELEKEI